MSIKVMRITASDKLGMRERPLLIQPCPVCQAILETTLELFLMQNTRLAARTVSKDQKTGVLNGRTPLILRHARVIH